MILRELITLVGFKVDVAPLKMYDTAITQVTNQASGLYSNLLNISNGLMDITRKFGFGAKVSLAGIGAASTIATAKVEKYQAAFEVMLKSEEKAGQLMKELFQFESVTPFNLEQVIQAANKLLIAKEAATNVTNQMRMLGDIAAGDAQRLQSIVYVLGQVRALGYLQGQDIMQFTNALVPIRDAISRVTGKAGKDLQKLIEQRKITADITQEALELIAKDRTGMMAKQARTLSGLWSSLMSAIFRLRNSIGGMIRDTLHLDKIIQKAINFMNMLTRIIDNLSPPMKKLIVWVSVLTFVLGPFLSLVLLIMKSMFMLKVLLFGIKWLLSGVSLVIKGLGLIGVRITLATFIPVLSKIAGLIAVMAVKFILISAAIAGIFVIVEDIIGYFTGKQSVIIPAILKLSDFLEDKIRSIFGMTQEEWNLTMMYFVKDWEETFGKMYDFVVKIFKKIQDAIKKYGILNLIMAPTPLAPLTMSSKGGRAIWGDLANFGVNTASRAFLPQSASSPAFAPMVNVNGIYLNIPDGTPKQQADSLKRQANTAVEKGIIDSMRKVIVKDIQGGTKD